MPKDTTKTVAKATIKPRTDLDQARKGLLAIRENHLLIAIDPMKPKSPAQAHACDVSDDAAWKAAGHWIKAQQARKRNVYFHSNPVKDGLTRKASKADMLPCDMLQCDLDPDGTGTFAQNRKALLARVKALREGPNPPTVLIDSGNGYNALWLLKTALPVAEFDQVNKAFNVALGIKGTFNADRIYKVPGTRAWPSAAKRKRGYPEIAQASLVAVTTTVMGDDVVADLGGAPVAKQVSVDSTTKSRFAAGDDPEGLAEKIADLRRSSAKIDAAFGDGTGDRSVALQTLAAAMKGSGWTPEEYAAAIMGHTIDASGHVIDQADPERTLARAWDRTTAEARKAAKDEFDAVEMPVIYPDLDDAFIATCDPLDRKVLDQAGELKWRGDPRFRKIMDQAKSLKVATEFRNALRGVEGQKRHEKAMARAPHKTEYDVRDPNDFPQFAREIVADVAARNMAFSFGGNPIVIRRSQSAMATQFVRDDQGQKVKDKHGEFITRPAINVIAQLMKVGDFKAVAASVGYFQVTSTNALGVTTITPKGVPPDLAAMMELPAARMLKPLQGIAAHPVMREGKLLFGDGVFHPASGLWLQTGDVEVEAWADPKAALKFLLEDWLGDFQFASDRDAMGALMLAASLLVGKSDMMNETGPPLFAIIAATAGTGKSHLADAINMAIAGEPAGMASYPDGEEERGKTITSAILEGSPHLVFDNVATGSTIGNSHRSLLMLVTAAVFEGRILGVSAMFKGPAGIVVTLTGNSLFFAADMASRVVEIRLNPPAGQNLAQRKFRHPNLIGWTRDNRGKIIGALACIMGVKGSGQTSGRFPKWAAVVADPILTVSGVTGFFDPWIEAAENDAAGNTSQQTEKLFAAIKAEFGSNMFTASELAKSPNMDVREVIGGDHLASVTDQAVTSYLVRHLNVTAVDLRLHGDRRNLGARTGRKSRRVFWIEDAIF